MAELTFFVYIPGDSLVHRLDPRCKLASLMMVGLAMVDCGFRACAAFFFLVCLIAAIGRIPLLSILRELKIFIAFLIVIVITRGVTTPGPSAFGETITWFSITGLNQGVLMSWRLLTVVIASSIFASSTKASDIFSAVRWYFSSIPGIDGTKIAMMLSLMVRFTPVLMNEASAVMDAQRARGIENRKNPVYRVKKMVPPMVNRTFSRAQDLAFALTARGFCSDPTPKEGETSMTDWVVLFVILCSCVCFRLID